ncbi:hypothetical protein AMS68_006520 [Peltaster fructicola]|uniref:BTB domain-containing protein n=1 Tax=Peltaster fructicola TaxID=286661 RepID=A0A6H0Y1V8_9PEZI|nr:hypothetical protein AMS68_006520 [Peltaster fructicola]
MASILGVLGLRGTVQPEDTTLNHDNIIDPVPSTDSEAVTLPESIALTSEVEEPTLDSPQRVSKLGKRRRSDGLYNYTIQVVCNTGESFDIHQGLLMDRSEEFARRTECSDPEVVSGVFKIDHDFNTVHAMKEFLYKKELPSSDDYGTDKEDEEKDDDDFDDESFDQRATSIRAIKKRRTASNDKIDTMTSESDISHLHGDIVLSLTKLIVLAEALKMQELCEAAADALIHKLAWQIDTPVDALIYAHDNTSATSVVRQILLVYSAKYMSSDEQETIVAAGLPRELVSDLLFALVDFVERGGKEKDWLEYATGKNLGRPLP